MKTEKCDCKLSKYYERSPAELTYLFFVNLEGDSTFPSIEMRQRLGYLVIIVRGNVNNQSKMGFSRKKHQLFYIIGKVKVTSQEIK